MIAREVAIDSANACRVYLLVSRPLVCGFGGHKLTARIYISDMNSPASISTAKIRNILHLITNRRSKKLVLLLIIKCHVSQQSQILRLEVLLVDWSPVFSLAEELVFAAVLYNAFVDAGCD